MTCAVKERSRRPLADDKVEQERGTRPFTSHRFHVVWAIGHADPEKMKGSAQEVQRMTPQELEKRRAKPGPQAKNLLFSLNPIDNANADLDKLGGLVRRYRRARPRGDGAAHLDSEEAAKAFHAVSAITRNCPPGQRNILSQRRGLVTYEVKGQLDAYNLDDGFLRSVVGQAESVDLDTQQKVSKSVRETAAETCAMLRWVLGRLELYFQKLIAEPRSRTGRIYQRSGRAEA
ncbi:hypothetical protein R1sor_021554 [Riccia sorocarpa]|uniref:Uncharacterized protein n=1 Tax=Riccia sorocarpa TaxID=122646 RepID=A0ABD3GHD6_9MARC